jgi:hypothetical protein
MKIYRFDEKTGKRVDKFGSDLIFSRIAWLNGAAKVSCFHLAPNGKVGYHQAVTPQLFLVVQGSGWARDEVNQFQSQRIKLYFGIKMNGMNQAQIPG